MYGNYLRDVEYGRNHSRNNGHFGLHVSKLAWKIAWAVAILVGDSKTFLDIKPLIGATA